VVEPPSDGGTPATAATRLARNHGARLTLVYPLSPVSPVLPAGTEGMAQREELAQAEPRVAAWVEAARAEGVRARGLVRAADREESVATVLEEGEEADLIVVPAVRSGAWNVFAGRLLERLARRLEPPVLAVHADDPLRFGTSLKIVVPVWDGQSALDTATRAASLLAEESQTPSLVLVRVRPDGDEAPAAPPALEAERERSRMAAALEELAAALRERGFDAISRLETGDTADALGAVAQEQAAGLVAIDPEVRQRIWPLRGALARLAPQLPVPVLAI
jgi:nucleotide-binding universal stress UspA family protein